MPVTFTQLDPNPTAQGTVAYAVTGLDPALNLTPGSFRLFTTGLTGAQITSVAGGGGDYAISVSTGTGDGTLSLSFAPNYVSTGFFATGGNAPNTPAIADFNEDGKADVLVPNYYSGTVALMLGNGDGTLQSPVLFPSALGGGYGSNSAQVGDFNGDGHVDVITSNVSQGAVAVLLGDGHGGFSAPVFTSTGSYTGSVVPADVNGDGRLDALATSSLGLSVLIGHGDGTFEAPRLIGAQDSAAAFGDMTGDGIGDVVTESGQSVVVLQGDGHGGFTQVAQYALGFDPSTGAQIRIADLNGDGRNDVFLTRYADHEVTVMLGDGSGGLGAPTSYFTGPLMPPDSIAAADVNGDGRLDILATGDGTTASVLLGHGDGTFDPGVTFANGYASHGAFGDLNGDGRTDIVSANYFGGDVNVLLDATPAGTAAAYTIDRTPPAAPAALADAAVLNGYVNAAADTAVQALTGTAEAGSTVAVFDGATELGVATPAADGAWSYTLGVLAEGSHALTATATDAAGNAGPASTPLAFVVDTTPPAAPSGLADGAIVDGYVNAARQAQNILTGSAEPGSTVTVWDSAASAPLGGTSADASGKWSYSLSGLGDGAHSLTATATDAAGNTGPASEALSFTLDTVAPRPVITNVLMAGGATLYGTAEPNRDVTVFDGGRLVGAATADADGGWSMGVPGQGDEVHAYTAQASDAAGNQGSSAGVALFTPAGHETLVGGGGDDVLVGRPNDVLTGGPGQDRFVFNPHFGGETITDFAVGGAGAPGDVIQFDRSLFAGFDAVLSHATQVGADTFIALPGDVLVLSNVAVSDLAPGDFLFA